MANGRQGNYVRLQWCYERAKRVLVRVEQAQREEQGDVEPSAVQKLRHVKEEKDLLLALIRLRQACCHPQVSVCF